jgi:nucleotide-binding universal stress UspA family protein
LTRVEREGQIRSILVPVDGSQSSRRAVRLAAEMARAFDAELTLLHVESIRGFPTLIAEANAVWDDEEAELVLGENAKIARSLEIEPNVVLWHGAIASQIVRFVALRRPDLVVMGTRGLTRAKGVLMGSVSQTVSRRSKSQVVLVR